MRGFLFVCPLWTTCLLYVSCLIHVNVEGFTLFPTAVSISSKAAPKHRSVGIIASSSPNIETTTNHTARKVLVIGSGGREFALTQALLRLSSPEAIYVAPGNAGTQQLSPSVVVNVPELKPNDFKGITDFAQKHGIEIVVVGPEDPLANGLQDFLRESNIPCFGPSAAAARLEGSKAWAKAFMNRHQIPTARHATFSDLTAALEYVEHRTLPMVVKASGLAGGKGVTIAHSREDARKALEAIMGTTPVFGPAAGAEVVIEEYLVGDEVSAIAFCDGDSVAACLPFARDYKRLEEHDSGPNTGGMGSFAPVTDLTTDIAASIQNILVTTVKGMREEGHPYHGVLYGGLIITKGGAAEDGREEVKVLEFNCRFGDPEAQSILPLLSDKIDLAKLMLQCAQGGRFGDTTGRLAASTPRDLTTKNSTFAATVIAASEGYPTATGSIKPHIIHGLPLACRVPGVCSVAQAGTARLVLANGARVVTVSGGRVLGVTGEATTLRLALLHAYHGLSEIRFQGMRCRTDIGAQAVRSQPVRVAILGSSRGTSVSKILTGKRGVFEVVLVMSDTQDANGILSKAQAAHVPDCRFLGADTGGNGDSEMARDTLEEKIEVAMEESKAEILLLNGYRRILSPRLCRVLRGRCLNIHPSLLPDFGGHFDLAVHQAVLDAGRTSSGCSVHFVTENVDQGPVLIQKTCSVEPGFDTAATLKAKVQELEERAWEEAVRVYQEDLPRITRAILSMSDPKTF